MKKMTSSNQNTKDIGKISIDVGIILKEVADLKADFKVMDNKLDSNYATKEWVELNFGQTKKIVNGLVTVILLAVLGAIVALVVR
jgi:hypothetical protein